MEWSMVSIHVMKVLEVPGYAKSLVPADSNPLVLVEFGLIIALGVDRH